VVGLVIDSEFFAVIGLIIESGERGCVLCDLTGQVQKEIPIAKNAKIFGTVPLTGAGRLIGVKTTTFIS
jgi:hypothetical protein